jgi:hypothetical protein
VDEDVDVVLSLSLRIFCNLFLGYMNKGAFLKGRYSERVHPGIWRFYGINLILNILKLAPDFKGWVHLAN